MKQYEYKLVLLEQGGLTVNKIIQKLELMLNEYGKEGWQLCAVDRQLAYLKREIVVE